MNSASRPGGGNVSLPPGIFDAFNGRVKMTLIAHDDSETVAAYHEAGHLLVAALIGTRVSRASVSPDGTGHILLHPSCQPDLTYPPAAADRVALLLGGQAAEWVYLAGVGRAQEFSESIDFDDDRRDMVEAIELAPVVAVGKGGDWTSAKVIRALGRMACEAVGRDWLTVEALAAELLRKRVLSGAEFSRIVNFYDLFGPLAGSL